MPSFVGPTELIVLLLVLVLLFGPKRLPEMGRGIGRGLREFKGAVSGREPQPRPVAVEAESQQD